MATLEKQYQSLMAELAELDAIEESNSLLDEYNRLQQELASIPITKQEYVEKRKADQEKSFAQSASEFGKGALEGAAMIAEQGGQAISETPFSALFDYDALGDIINVGARDFVRFAKTLGGAAMDKLGGYSEDEEIDREYKRYLENFNYHTKVRPVMLESDEVEYKALTDFGANFVDPFMAFPVAKVGSLAIRAPLIAAQKAATAGAIAARSGNLVNLAKFAKGTAKAVKSLEKGVDIAGKIGAYPTEMAARKGSVALRKGIKGTALGAGVALKGISKVGSGVEVVASAPRRGVAAFVSRLKDVGEGAPGAAALTGQVAGAIGGIPGFLELGIAEGIGTIARRLGMGAGQFLTALGKPGANKRFLYRLATDDNVSPQMRRAAMFAFKTIGTPLGDGAFNMIANGVSIGALNAALAGAAGEDARTVGQGFGAGAAAGGFLPFGQRGMRGGKLDVDRDAKSIDQHMQNKLNTLQKESFKKLPKPAQLMLATLQESGLGAPKFLIIEPKTYLEMLNKDRAEKGLQLLDRAPAGHFDKPSRTIYVNEANLPKGARVATEIAAHEVGHDYVYQALGNDPAMLQILLEEYKTTPEKGTAFYFQFESKPATSADVKAGLAEKVGQIIDGDPIGDPIYINEDGVQISIDYDRKQKGIGIGRNASKLAQEIGADQFAMMFSKDPNAFNNFHPSLRKHLVNASRKLLARIGVTEPMTGNPLSNPISKVMLNNPEIRRLFENYGNARSVELDEKGNLANNGVLIRPKEGQTGEERFVELFGGQGLSLRDSKNLAISNKTLIRKLKEIMKGYEDDPKDTWFVSSGKFLGKNLLPDLRTIFTRNDPFGNVANILDALQEAINQRIGITFGYRSGTKGKYQNPFKQRDIAIYGWEVSGFSRGRPTLKVTGYNQAVIRTNIQTLVERGYVKDPKDFMRQLEEQGQKALDDPEGRINPEGRKENELMTVAFGLKESAPNVASPGLRDLLESKAIKKSFVSFDVEALAGLTKGRDKAFAFDYTNIRDNYNPFRQGDQNLFLPVGEADVRRRAEGTQSEVREPPPSETRRTEVGDKLYMPYHGTPYTLAPEPGAPLGRFRTSKIGTGEGAQAYGHGLYFAGKKEVADHYRKVLSGRKDDILQEYDGKPFDRTNPKHEAARRLRKEARMLGVNKDQVRGRVQSIIEDKLRRTGLNPTIEEGLRDTLEVIKNKQEAKVNEGSLYKVELAPKENEYLLWDAPVPDRFIDKIVEKSVDEGLVSDRETAIEGIQSQDADRQGAILYRELSDQVGGDKAASQFLKEAGIPGIKYLDGSSRSKGEGDYNYVIFDEADVTVTDKLFMPANEQADLDFQISTRNPTARNRTEDPVSSNLVITLNDILEAPGVAESYAKAVNRYPGFKASRAKPETVIEKFVSMVESNLLHLYDAVDPEIRERSKLWYVGARKIALEYAEKYGFSNQAVAAVMAATSPQTDWYKNVDRARRILETVKDEQDTVFTEEMAKKTINNASKTEKPLITALAESMVGTPFKDLSQKKQAYFIRAFDELNRDRTYQIISPEGDFLGPALKDDGEIDQYSWLSYNQITKALSALSDDSKANISNTMGEAHKIRNFYNNILLPFLDTQAVTVDTHAVAAGLLRPLASKDLEVANMLGAKLKGKQHVSIKNSSISGVSGLYGVYAEAYRRAAKARGVLPREMQSITWEAIRGLYPKEIKQPKFKQQIKDLFLDYENGKISIDDLRSKIFDKAGGIDPPSWAEGNNTPRENRPRGGGDSQGDRVPTNEGELFYPSVRGFGSRDRPRGVRDSSARATPGGVNRFMIPAAARAAVTSEVLDQFQTR